jgi:Helicase conserved C-terminal domain
MSYYNRYYNQPRDRNAEHEKSWDRTKALAWDDKWQALSVPARRAYLLDIKAPTREGSSTQPSIPVDRIPPEIIEELTSAGFVKVETSKKKAARVVATQAAHDFSSRLRSAHRYNVLGPPDRQELAKSIKHAFLGQGETTIQLVLYKAGIQDYSRLEEALGLYVTTRRWPDWALLSCKSKAAKPLLDALGKAPGPVALAELPALLKEFSPDEVQKALTDLIGHLAAFEDVKPETFEIIVGLLPEVRDDQAEAAKPRKRPPLVVCEHPKEVGPLGGLDVNDLRSFLLEVATESPRLRQDSGIFAKEEPRLRGALPPRPAWLDVVLKSSNEHRVYQAYSLARMLRLVEFENEDKTTWLRLSGKGRNWLAAGFEEQYARIYEHYRSTSKKKDFDNDYDYDYDYSFGDSRFLGVPVSVIPYKAETSRYYSYYEDLKPEQRDAIRAALYKVFKALPVGVYHRWDSVLDHSVFNEHNPLTQGADPSKLMITVDRRQVPRLPEQVEQAGKMFLEAFTRLRLLPYDAVRAAIDDEGRLCIARLARLDGYFGRPYKTDEDHSLAATRVVVQPDFSVLVIGLDPSPAAEIAPFAERAGGQTGQGALTFKITRNSVIRAASQGLGAPAIIARLKKHASVDVPENVLREIREWADWVRLVNVRNITVVRCPDKQTVARVVSALGKKAEGLSDTLVALHVPRLTALERQKLQEQGILVTKDDITIPQEVEPVTEKPTESLAPPKKRGRPRKVR